MMQRQANKPGFRRKLLAGFAAGALTGLAVFELVNASPMRAQSPPTTAAPLPSFEVASIKPYKPDSSGTLIMGARILPGRYVATALTLKDLVAFAYDVVEAQVSGGPSWIGRDRYDIDAREEEADATALQKLPREQQSEQIRLMVQSLLADRMKLKVSHETRELPVYKLIVARNGPKFHESKPKATPAAGTMGPNGHARPETRPLGGFPGDTRIFATEMPPFAKALSFNLGRIVLDETGLKGKYDLRLDFAPYRSQSEMFGGTPIDKPLSPDSSGPSIFTALQEQLGLKLESTKGPVEVIVIDHIEKPSEN